MILTTNYSGTTVSIGGVDVTDKVLDLEVARTNIIQCVINLVPGHNLNPKPGQLVTLDLPIATTLVLQTYVGNRVTAGCYLAVYLQAAPSDPSKQLKATLGDCLSNILKDRGIPNSALSVATGKSVALGAIPTLGDNPVDLANYCGYSLYSDSMGRVRLTPLLKPEKLIGDFEDTELVADPDNGTRNPLSANRVVVQGVLSKVDKASTEYKVETSTAVRGGTRTVVKEFEVGRGKTIETETIKEPRSQISTFSSNYEGNKSDPEKLLNAFNQQQKSKSIVSQVTTVTTEVDRKTNLLTRREKVVKGVAAKGLSQFFAAWAGAELPVPPVEPETATTEVEFTEVSSSSPEGGYDFDPPAESSVGTALTLAKPTGLFNEITIEYELEEWNWDLDDELEPITNPNTKSVTFSKNRGKVEYSRVKYLPIGAILPEMGNPVFGYQTPTAGQSRPRYRDGSKLTVAEKEVVIYTQEESGEWVAERRLEQAIGIRNAQEPLDAMRSVQFIDPIAQATRDRGSVAINVATQLTLGINERIRSSPPAPVVIDNTLEYTKTRPYKFVIELSDEDLLDRSIQISPSPFVPSIPAIVDYAKYQALVTKGEAKTLVLQLALEGLDFDIPPNSLLRYSGNTYLVNQVKVNIRSGYGVITLTCYPW